MFPKPIEVSAELAEAARNCPEWPSIAGKLGEDGRPGDPAEVLAAWMASVSDELGLPAETGLSPELSPLGTLWKNALCVLAELSSTDGPRTIAELSRAQRGESSLAPGIAPCMDCGKAHELSPVDASAGTPGKPCSRAAAGRLAEYGAVGWAEAGPDGMVWLTPLGKMLAASIFTGCAPAADVAAETMVTAIMYLPPGIMIRMAQPWLAGHTPAGAVRELLTFAEPRACTGPGWAALVLAAEAGPQARLAWREWARKPGFGVYARNWLTDHGEPASPLPGDNVWLGIDGMVARLAEDPEAAVSQFAHVMGLDLRGADELVLTAMRQCGHPEAPRLVEILRRLRSGSGSGSGRPQ